MKKLLFLCVLVTVSLISTGSFAQETANLNITLSDVIEFTVTQPAELTVDFNSEEKYTDGITALATDHISVKSSKGYVVKAIAGTVTGPSSLTPGSVKITSAIGTTNDGNTADISYASEVALPASGGTAVVIVDAQNSSWDGAHSTNKFNVSYLIGADGAYAGKPTGANVIPVLYSVEQQ